MEDDRVLCPKCKVGHSEILDDDWYDENEDGNATCDTCGYVFSILWDMGRPYTEDSLPCECPTCEAVLPFGCPNAATDKLQMDGAESVMLCTPCSENKACLCKALSLLSSKAGTPTTAKELVEKLKKAAKKPVEDL
jgi:hypothetical protein